MTTSIDVLDGAALERLEPGHGRRAYLAALAHDGTRSYVENADVELKVVVVDGTALPLLVGRDVEGNTDLCSPLAHYVLYTLEELAKRRRGIPPALLQAVTRPPATVLRLAGIDRAVFLNNWLWSTNPSLSLDSTQLAALTTALAAAHPDAAIVVRSVNPELDPDGTARLRESGYRLVRSRRVYLVDPCSAAYSARSNSREDAALLGRTPYGIETRPDVLAPHVPRMAQLYRDLYVEKHSRLNARLTERFFALTLDEAVFSYCGFVRDGRLDAFIAWYVHSDTMLRGAVPVEEFDAVYDRHLPLHRRLAWTLLGVATGWAATTRVDRRARPAR